MEFEDHRPFYDWVLSNIDDFKDAPTKQIEFAKLFLSKTMMGKRYLKQMVEEGYVAVSYTHLYFILVLVSVPNAFDTVRLTL